MADLRVTGTDNDVLLLADDRGGTHRLPVDDTLRTAMRRSESSGTSALTPRQIQDRLRLGASAEQVAAAAGVSVERIRRWEGPVLAERAHALDRARATRFARPPDGNYSGPLGRLVEQRLSTAGLVGLWDAFRDPAGGWVVRVEHDRGVAEWDFDGMALRARDPQAEALGYREPPRAVDPVSERNPVREREAAAAAATSPRDKRGGRAALPSWDSILESSPPPNAFPT